MGRKILVTGGAGFIGSHEVYPRLRLEEQLTVREWEMRYPICRQPVDPLPTDEEKSPYPTSIYAITKKDQMPNLQSVWH